MKQRSFEAVARAGARDQFDVVVDGETVFSKEREHRFPEDGEVQRLVNAR